MPEGIVYPVTYQFKLRPTAIFALVPVNAVQVMKAESCGLTSGAVSNAVASGAFNNCTLERFALLLKKNGQTNRTILFLQSAP